MIFIQDFLKTLRPIKMVNISLPFLLCSVLVIEDKLMQIYFLGIFKYEGEEGEVEVILL